MRGEDLADRPVHLLDHVAEQAALGLAAELVGDVQRHVHHRVRHVEEERLVLVPVNEAHGVLGVPGGQHVLRGVVHVGVDDGVLVDERQRDVTFDASCRERCGVMSLE